ncbi:helix-turn-helix domain-containing protein [Actinomadura adrarensis]|uniref:Helix-turn-helix domain-containing protein n=1 Tax=Actinomadura adrarensis TaxID=1819600 RepID=A0ABW3C9C6_9ACTN
MGIELRRLREAAGLSVQQAGELLCRSPSSISKYENGQVRLYRRELDRILDRYGLEDEALRARLHTLNDKGRQKGWWLQYRNIANPALIDYVSLEAEAEAIREYQPLLIPGLFQTEEYARAVITGEPGYNPEEPAEPYVELRLGRQRLLTGGSPPPMQVIIGEAALRQVRGGREVMIDQLQLLGDLGQLDYLTLQVLPFTVSARGASEGPLVMLDVAPSHCVVMSSHALGAVYSDLETTVERSTLVFEGLRRAALPEAESLAFVARVSAEL